MQTINDKEEYLVDLARPELVPEKLSPPKTTHEVPGISTSYNAEQSFKLTGWRGAGWHMVFLEKPVR